MTKVIFVKCDENLFYIPGATKFGDNFKYLDASYQLIETEIDLQVFSTSILLHDYAYLLHRSDAKDYIAFHVSIDHSLIGKEDFTNLIIDKNNAAQQFALNHIYKGEQPLHELFFSKEKEPSISEQIKSVISLPLEWVYNFIKKVCNFINQLCNNIFHTKTAQEKQRNSSR
jgi:hypothetical protein